MSDDNKLERVSIEAEVYDPLDPRWHRIRPEHKPKGHEKWSRWQTTKYLENLNRRLRKAASWERIVLKLAKNEAPLRGSINVRDVERDPVHIEATYGMLTGTPALSIVVRAFEGQSLDTERGVHQLSFQHIDGLGPNTQPPLVFMEMTTPGRPIGPRYFIQHLFKVIGFFGGHAHVVLRPSNKEFDVEPNLFRELVNNDDSIKLLAGNLNLLEDRA